MDKISYKSSGVDIDAGNSFVDAIKSDVKSTFNRDVIGGIGHSLELILSHLDIEIQFYYLLLMELEPS